MRGLDERATHVGVLDHALPVGDAGFLGVPDRGGCARFWRGDHEVGVDGVFARKLAPHLDARLVHATPVEVRVRAREVDVLEYAALANGFEDLLATQAVFVDRDELAGRNFAHEARAANIEGGGLGGHNPPVRQPAEHERADTLRVTRRVQGLFIHEHEAVGTADTAHEVLEVLLEASVVIEKGRHDRRVGRVDLLELTDFRAALALVEKLEELEGVHEVAIMGEGDRAVGSRAERRLGVHPVACPGRGIARVAHGHVTLESL